MPVAIAPQVTLAGDEQARLESLVRAHSTPQTLAYRCRVILRAAAPDHSSNLQVASELQGLSGLQDAPRPGRPRRFPPSQRLDVMSMATRKPATYYCPATRWGLDEKPVVSNVRDGHGLALDPNDLSGPCIHPDLTSEPLHDWQRIYEMDI